MIDYRQFYSSESFVEYLNTIMDAIINEMDTIIQTFEKFRCPSDREKLIYEARYEKNSNMAAFTSIKETFNSILSDYQQAICVINEGLKSTGACSDTNRLSELSKKYQNELQTCCDKLESLIAEEGYTYDLGLISIDIDNYKIKEPYHDRMAIFLNQYMGRIKWFQEELSTVRDNDSSVKREE